MYYRGCQIKCTRQELVVDVRQYLKMFIRISESFVLIKDQQDIRNNVTSVTVQEQTLFYN